MISNSIIDARCDWWAHQDSNLGQAGYEPAALTTELWARRWFLGSWFFVLGAEFLDPGSWFRLTADNP